MSFFYYICHMVETKSKIIQSAIVVWKQNLNASLDDIASHLGISRRTLHRHFSGRNDLVNSVFEILLQEYLSNVRQAIETKSNAVDKLKVLFLNDIESAEKYILFSHIQTTSHLQESQDVKELFTIYSSLFNQLIATNKISERISLRWLELFYSTIIQTVINAIKSDLNKEDFVDMAWVTFWNGIKKDK